MPDVTTLDVPKKVRPAAKAVFCTHTVMLRETESVMKTGVTQMTRSLTASRTLVPDMPDVTTPDVVNRVQSTATAVLYIPIWSTENVNVKKTGLIRMTKSLTVRHVSDNDVLINLRIIYETASAIQGNIIGTSENVCHLID